MLPHASLPSLATLHHLSGGSGGATHMLINLGPAGSPDQMKSELTTLA